MATNKSLQYKKELIEAMEMCHGIVSDACKSVGVSRVTYYDYYKNDSEFKDSIDEIECSVLDYVENKLFLNIEKGDVTCMIFYLKTKGKKRGYVEKSEIDHNISFPTLPDIIIE
jgi:hypothetical protein